MSAWKNQPNLQAWLSLLNDTASHSSRLSQAWVSPTAHHSLRPGLQSGSAARQGDQISQTASWGRSQCCTAHRAEVASRHSDPRPSEESIKRS